MSVSGATGVLLLPAILAQTHHITGAGSVHAMGWFIVLALPNIHTMSARARYWTITSGFAFTVQALFFAPRVAPFLYFRF